MLCASLHQDADQIPWPDAIGDKPPGKRVGLLVQLSVRVSAIVLDQGQRVWRCLGLLGEDLVQAFAWVRVDVAVDDGGRTCHQVLIESRGDEVQHLALTLLGIEMCAREREVLERGACQLRPPLQLFWCQQHVGISPRRGDRNVQPRFV